MVRQVISKRPPPSGTMRIFLAMPEQTENSAGIAQTFFSVVGIEDCGE